MNSKYTSGTAAFALLTCLLGALRATAGEPPVLVVRSQTILESKAWTWNWSSWDQEKIVTAGDFQYTVFWNAARQLVLARRDLRDNQMQTLVLSAYTLSADDRHRNTCLGISSGDGRLHLSWDHHNNPLHYTRSRAGFLDQPPVDMSASDIEPAQSMLPDPKLESLVTYPRFFNDHDGNLYFFYRIGSSGSGDHYLHRYDSQQGSWQRIGMIFAKRGTYAPWQDSTSRCAYLQDLVFDRNNRLHLSWVYRESGASWASNHDLHYAYSDDQGETWQNNTGEKVADLAVGDPIELVDPGIVVRDIPVFSWLMNAGCMALDGKDRPHVVTFKLAKTYRPETLSHSPPDDIRQQTGFVHYWRADDGRWLGGELIQAGPTGTSRVDMAFDSADNLYFYYPTELGFRYFVSPASSNWQDWSGPRILTGPELTGRDASKYDRRRWSEKGILSFTAKSLPSGFTILDVVPTE